MYYLHYSYYVDDHHDHGLKLFPSMDDIQNCLDFIMYEYCTKLREKLTKTLCFNSQTDTSHCIAYHIGKYTTSGDFYNEFIIKLPNDDHQVH